MITDQILKYTIKIQIKRFLLPQKIFRFNFRKFYFLIIFQFLLGADDTESWNSIGFEKKIPLALKVNLEQSLRLKDNLSSFKQTFTEITISRKIFDDIKIFVPLRYASYKDKTKQRFSFGGSVKYSIKPLAFKYRLKYQKTYLERVFSDDVFRNKFSVVYKINKKFDSYTSIEIFHLNQLDQYLFNEYRISFGLDIDLPNKKAVKVFYTRKIKDLNKSDPDQTNILGIAYDFK